MCTSKQMGVFHIVILAFYSKIEGEGNKSYEMQYFQQGLKRSTVSPH